MKSMLVIVLIILFSEHRSKQIKLFIAAVVYLMLIWKCLQIEDLRFV